MTEYDSRSIEPRWQKYWEAKGIFNASGKGNKVYCLVEFPYPSSDGLHVGHPRSYTAIDIIARKKRMEGFDVLFPIGFDAFGLPTENYAIKMKRKPQDITKENIENFRRQLQSLGFSFDWDREVNTSDPAYYRWTQWLFLQFYNAGLVYQAEIPINWCPKDKIGLANEEVVDGKCERCGTPVTRRNVRQWLFRITKYAQRLIDDLDTVDYLDKVKTQQINWIGRSEGAEVEFDLRYGDEIDFLILHGYTGSPNDNFIPWLKKQIENRGYAVQAPQLPNTNNPIEKEQAEFIINNCHIGPNTIIIGHSLGAGVGMKVLEKINKKIRGFVAVGAATLEAFGGTPRPWWPNFSANIDFKKIIEKTNFRIVLSDTEENDKQFRVDYQKRLASNLQAKLIEAVAKKKHFCATKEPIIFDSVIPRINIFTTRPDTIFGATYMVLAPEHPLVDQLKSSIQNWNEVEKYRAKAASKSDMERTELAKDKTGVELKGIRALNPMSKEEIPVWIADYVLLSYGTGAIMAVPAHDERDYEFAKKFKLPIREVIAQKFGEKRFDAIRRDSAAAVIIKNGKVLVLHNKRFNTYTVVSGGYEKNETPEQTLKREIEEETGFNDIAIKEYLGQIEENFYVAEKSEWRQKLHKCYRVELLSERKGKMAREDYEQYEILWLEPDKAIEKISLIQSGEEEFIRRAIVGTELFYSGEGTLVNSKQFDDLPSEKARKDIIKVLEKMDAGKTAIQYKLRDWVFSRQHYWGEPIPLIHCGKCGVQPVAEKDLPVVLPAVDKYEPTDTGESPLAAISKWVNVKCPNCGGPAKRETDTMPNWAGSSWYFMRYTDPHNAKAFASMKQLKHWLPVDLYNGGMEHTVLHLLYSRFWYKALYDLKLAPTSEPYQHRVSHGLVLAEDGQKMSKSRGNVINPNDIVREYGADTLRLYLMFMGPYAEPVSWSTNGIFGVKRFLERVWDHFQQKPITKAVSENTALLHKTIAKVTADIEGLRFNTAVSSFMILLNSFQKHGSTKSDRELFLKLLTPFAPHIAEELWQRLGHTHSVHLESWPIADLKLLKDKMVSLVIQVNGKVRARLDIHAGIDEAEARAQALALENVKKFVPGDPRKVIFVKDRLINFVV